MWLSPSMIVMRPPWRCLVAGAEAAVDDLAPPSGVTFVTLVMAGTRVNTCVDDCSAGRHPVPANVARPRHLDEGTGAPMSPARTASKKPATSDDAPAVSAISLRRKRRRDSANARSDT